MSATVNAIYEAALELNGEELKQLIAQINGQWKGLTMKTFIVQNKDGLILEAFAFEEHAAQYVNSTLAPELRVTEKTVWWSFLRPSDHLPPPGGKQDT